MRTKLPSTSKSVSKLIVSKYLEYLDTKKQLEALQSIVKILERDPHVQAMLKFRKKLEELMIEYGMSRSEVRELWGLNSIPSVYRKARVAKIFQNPNTGQIIVTKSGNHKIIKAWRAEFGAETVAQWEKYNTNLSIG